MIIIIFVIFCIIINLLIRGDLISSVNWTLTFKVPYIIILEDKIFSFLWLKMLRTVPVTLLKLNPVLFVKHLESDYLEVLVIKHEEVVCDNQVLDASWRFLPDLIRHYAFQILEVNANKLVKLLL